MRLTMQITVQGLRANSSARRSIRAMVALGLMLMLGCVESGLAQTPPLNIFKNYFVTGDYVVAGWVPGSPNVGGYAPGTISFPDTRQSGALVGSPVGPTSVPKGADIVAAYLYWATVEASTNAFVGQKAFFNGYAITGTVLGNPNAPTSWSSGGCSGSSQGSKTMRAYRADVRPYLPLDLDPLSSTFGALLPMELRPYPRLFPCAWPTVEAMATPHLLPWARAWWLFTGSRHRRCR